MNKITLITLINYFWIKVLIYKKNKKSYWPQTFEQ